MVLSESIREKTESNLAPNMSIHIVTNIATVQSTVCIFLNKGVKGTVHLSELTGSQTVPIVMRTPIPYHTTTNNNKFY